MKCSLKFSIFLLLILSCNFSGSEKSDTPNKKQSGKDIYHVQCVGCHGVSGNLSIAGAGDLSKSTLSLQEIENQVKNGKGSMYPFSSILTSEEIKAVSEYALSLRNNKIS